MAHKLSFIFLSSSGKTITRCQCSRLKLSALAVLVVAIFSLLGYGAFDYARLHKARQDLQSFQRELVYKSQEIQEQRRQIQTFAREINELKDRLVQLSSFEEKIRILANLDRSDKNAGLFGVGGSAPEDLNPTLELTQKHANLIKDMHQQVAQLDNATAFQKDSFSSLLKKLEQQKNLLAHTPAIKPADGWIASSFGYRDSPFTGKREFHKGIDIANRHGTPILASADGVISFIGQRGSLGLVAVIDHGHGLTTRYAHLSKALKKKGEQVVRGETIALMGSSGRSTGPHLHYEVRLNGVQVNPAGYILN